MGGVTSFPARETVLTLDDGVPRAELHEWSERYGLVAGVTTRAASGDDFNLGLASQEPADAIFGRWQRVIGAFAPDFHNVVLSRQPHGAALLEHKPPLPITGWLVLDGYDGHLTAKPGVLLTVTIADCVPVYLADPKTGAVALLHAGWRGIAAGVLKNGIHTMCEISGSAPDELVMHCGVAISAEAYEVGEEVFGALGLATSGGPGFIDLRAILARDAATMGMRQISISPWCTFRDRELFFSHRRDGASSGRMIAYLGKPAT